MICNITISYENLEQAIHFYTGQLGLFRLKHDFGEGVLMLQYIYSKDFYLNLSPRQRAASDLPLFSVEVPDCGLVFRRISNIHFSYGAGIVSNGPRWPDLIDYPLGRFFTMKDPSGNKFSIYEWYLVEYLDNGQLGL